ncbi:MAG: LON peptidase substrate-binding domain-containing protein [Verrucomicrobiales bacterium]|nr:LON peptidase substrate-binding domain-containing protein [Verrucomicrobiales bacterium]
MVPATLEKLPESIPVMVLPCTLFPHCLLPLYIFEPRYRAMLSTALAADRMFCIGTVPEGGEPDDIAPISTAGLVRACVTHENGTSHLILVGTKRIRFTGWRQMAPFRIATIEPIDCEIEDADLAERLASETIDLVEELTGPDQTMSVKLHDNLRLLNDPSAVADVIAHTFVTGATERQRLLETRDVVERLHCVNQFVQTLIAGQS